MTGPADVTGSDGRRRARIVIEKAVRGELSLEELHHQWPSETDPLLDLIFEETEDTLEHEPRSSLRRSHPWPVAAHGLLVLDAQILDSEFAPIASERLAELRGELIREVDLLQDDLSLAAAVRAFLARRLAS